MAQHAAYKWFDPPRVLIASDFNIPKSSDLPLQVIADTGPITGVGIQYGDTTGAAIEVYTGEVGQEKFLCLIGNSGIDVTAWIGILPNQRISLRAAINEDITTGYIWAALLKQW